MIFKRIKIVGDRVFLNKLSQKNATKEYYDWLNDPEVNKYLETRKVTIAELRGYIREKNTNPNCLFLGIFLKENKKHIGNIKLEPINFKNKKATLGILIGNKDYWGRGIGGEATKLLVDYAFSRLNLKEVNLGVISENKKAITFFKKVGFKINQTKKNSIRHGKKLFNKTIMSIKK